jgi:hypothetical protein
MESNFSFSVLGSPSSFEVLLPLEPLHQTLEKTFGVYFIVDLSRTILHSHNYANIELYGRNMYTWIVSHDTDYSVSFILFHLMYLWVACISALPFRVVLFI